MGDFTLYFFVVLMSYGFGFGTVYLSQYLLRRRQQREWIQRNPRAHSILVDRLKREEWSER